MATRQSRKSRDRKELTVNEAFAQRMREARKSAGLSQAQLADRLAGLGYARRAGGGKEAMKRGVERPLSRATINELELGKRGPTLEEALYIAAALNVAPSAMFAPLAEADDGRPNYVRFGPSLLMTPSLLRERVRGDTPWPLDSGGADEERRYFLIEAPPEKRALADGIVRAIQRGRTPPDRLRDAWSDFARVPRAVWVGLSPAEQDEFVSWALGESQDEEGVES